MENKDIVENVENVEVSTEKTKNITNIYVVILFLLGVGLGFFICHQTFGSYKFYLLFYFFTA